MVVKVATSLDKFPTATHRELKVYEHLAAVDSLHPGQSLIRGLVHSLELDGPRGRQAPVSGAVADAYGCARDDEAQCGAL